MCDEAQTLLALLQLSEQHVIRVNAVRHSLQIANVARPAQHVRIADHGKATGCEVGQVGDDEIRQSGDRSIVFGHARFVVETGHRDKDRICAPVDEEPGREQQQRQRETAARTTTRPRTRESEPRSRGSRTRFPSVSGEWFDGYRSNELISALGKRLNESRVVATVTEGGPNLRQAICQATIEVDMRLAAPHALAQCLTGDEFARTRQEDGQYSRRLPFERQRARILSQLAAFDLKVKDPKPISHGASTISEVDMSEMIRPKTRRALVRSANAASSRLPS